MKLEILLKLCWDLIEQRKTLSKEQVRQQHLSFGAENATFFYQQEEWVSGRDMYYIEVGDLPFYICCFLTSVFQILATKYSYNNGLFPDKLKKEKIMLPINNESGKIDYTYMEEFMKNKFFECKECFTSIVAV